VPKILAYEPAQNATASARYRQTAKRFFLLFSAIAIAYVLEARWDLHERFDEYLEDYEFLHIDMVFIGFVAVLLVSLFFKLVDQKREMAARLKAEQHALMLANHDPLTGLGNRRQLEQALTDVGQGDLRAVLMIDLDDFKPVNDIFGHAAGDAVLQDAARRLTTVCGADNLVCRFGGDEFAVLTGPIGGLADAELLARQIVSMFDKPFITGTAESRMGASIGVALHRTGETTAQDTIRHADVALYRAKEDNQTTYQVFEQRMDDELRRKNLMEQKLRRAITFGAVQPYFQPLVNLKTSELIGFEALARWHDPDFGQVSPVDFILLAEETGLITSLSEHLLRAACREAVRWPGHLKLSFNLSPKQLKDRLIGLRILAILGETGLSPRRLEIEVTEGSLVEDKDLARELLTGLREAGVKIAIDDFGTGYSSLYHLREFKFDNLKIDRSFVMTMQRDSENAVIIEAILNLSRGLGLTATAEGIEREEQLSSLIASGCEQGQGYLFGRAMPAAEVMAMIDELAPEARRA
jgi:diguanylate cyclase (GGDEF)-like protein